MPPGSGGDPPLGALVSKLLGALAASEKFAVQLNPISPQPTLSSLYGGYRAGLQREHARCAAWALPVPLTRACPPAACSHLLTPAPAPCHPTQAPQAWPAAAWRRGWRR